MPPFPHLEIGETSTYVIGLMQSPILLFTEKEYANVEILNWKSGGQGFPLAFAPNLLTLRKLFITLLRFYFLHHLKSLDTLGFLKP